MEFRPFVRSRRNLKGTNYKSTEFSTFAQSEDTGKGGKKKEREKRISQATVYNQAQRFVSCHFNSGRLGIVCACVCCVGMYTLISVQFLS